MASFSMNRNSVKIDAHLSEDDERGLPNQENSKRMAAAYPQGLANFTQMLSERKTDAYDYLLMLGDMVSFPTAKGVETVMELAGKTGLPFAYTAGNHDWHFEGLPGTEIALRREWEAKRLAPLHRTERLESCHDGHFRLRNPARTAGLLASADGKRFADNRIRPYSVLGART